MKRLLPALAACAILQAAPLAALDLTVAGKTSAFVFNAAGIPTPDALKWGLDFSAEDQIAGNLSGMISFDMDPEIGNMLKARGTYRTKFLEISAGPSFGVMNAPDSSGVTNIIQPGLGIGLNVIIPGFAVARADTDFALPTSSGADGHVFLQRSSLQAGFYLPYVLCTFGISQKTNTESGAKITAITDVGVYTESFKKGSPFRISLDFIYRVMDYYVASGSPLNTKTGHIVLGGGLTWTPKDDLSLFVKGDGAVYSFSLGSSLAGLDKFLFDVKIGVRYRINTSQN